MKYEEYIKAIAPFENFKSRANNCTDNKFKHIFEEQSDSSIIVKVPMIRVDLPIDYFEHHISEIVGSDVETLCVFNFDTFGENVKEYTEPSTLKSKRYLFKFISSIGSK